LTRLVCSFFSLYFFLSPSVRTLNLHGSIFYPGAVSALTSTACCALSSCTTCTVPSDLSHLYHLLCLLPLRNLPLTPPPLPRGCHVARLSTSLGRPHHPLIATPPSITCLKSASLSSCIVHLTVCLAYSGIVLGQNSKHIESA